MSSGNPVVPFLTDLAGYTHFVASRQGLFVTGPGRSALFASGRWFGLTLRNGQLYGFNHCDKPYIPTCTGRVMRFTIGSDAPAEVLLDGLENGCHQMDFIGDRLIIADTYKQRLLIWSSENDLGVSTPIPPVPHNIGPPEYVHMNSITARGDRVWLMLHNGGQELSEIACLDLDLIEQSRVTLAGKGCHNIVVLEDGELLYCSSLDGRLRSNRGLTLDILPGLMTRGLSVGAETIAIGSALFGNRAVRQRLPGMVTLLDRSYHMLDRIIVPGAPTDIRRIDGHDLSLANYVG